MVTIQDVAKKAGVSVSTVSRVLNNNFMVTEEKRKLVLDAVKSTGYTAIRAKSTKRAKNKMVMVITSFLMMEMCEFIREAAIEMGYPVLFNFAGDSSSSYQNSADVLRVLRNDSVAGIILVNAVYKDPSLELYFKHFPVVQIGEEYPYTPSYTVNIDDFQAGYDITTYLLNKGYKNIGFVGIDRGLEHDRPDFSENRYKGYRQALKDRGATCNDAWVTYTDYSTEGGTDAAKAFHKMDNRPDAVCCVSDVIAVGCVNEFKQLGLSLPTDIAVTGFDNSNLTDVCTPGLTSVAQDYQDIGREAIQMLDSLIHGGLGKGRKVIIPHEIVERGSA